MCGIGMCQRTKMHTPLEKNWMGGSCQAVETQQVAWLTFVKYAQNQGVALVGEEDFDGIMGIAAICKKLELGVSWFFKKLELGSCFGQRHVSVAFIGKELLQHFVCERQTRPSECGAVFPTIAGASKVMATCFRKSLAHGHMRL